MSTPTSNTAPIQQPHDEDHDVTSSVKCIRPKDWSGEHKTTDLLDEDNWQAWRDDIDLAFDVCGLRDYVEGTLPCPNQATDPGGAANWKYNDGYTKKVIRDRMSRAQKYHITNCKTSQEMWSNLQAIHQACGDQTENQLMRELTDTKARKGDDIIEHLAKVKQLWDRITLVCQGDLPMSPPLFKKFMAYSLPRTWDDFTRQFTRDTAKKNISILGFIGECHEKYRRRTKRDNDDANSSYAATNRPLTKRIGNAVQKQNNSPGKKRLRCTHCGRNNHLVENCYHLDKPKCSGCDKLGHKVEKCRSKKKSVNLARTDKDKMVADALAPVKEAHLAK